jgi:hypothetical protein
MAQVRGAVVSGTVNFVRDAYGPDAHERVLAALSPADRAALRRAVRETAFMPLGPLVAYIEAARDLLAESDPGFLRAMGRYSGQRMRETQGFKVMVADPEAAVRMAPVTWKAFYDVGRADARMVAPREALVRLHDFPSRPSLCERSCGALEGLVSTPTLQATVAHTGCIARGEPWCEWRIVWEEAEPA